MPGARKFGKITQENVGKPFAIVLDDKVISAPNIREPILGGSGIISGSFTVESANELSVLLRAGALPAPLNGDRGALGRRRARRRIRSAPAPSPASWPRCSWSALMLVYYGIFGADRRRRPGAQRGPDPGHHVAARRHADPAGHRRHRAHHRPGGRFQRADLRAHPRGDARRAARRCPRSTPASTRRCAPSSTPT